MTTYCSDWLPTLQTLQHSRGVSFSFQGALSNLLTHELIATKTEWNCDINHYVCSWGCDWRHLSILYSSLFQASKAGRGATHHGMPRMWFYGFLNPENERSGARAGLWCGQNVYCDTDVWNVFLNIFISWYQAGSHLGLWPVVSLKSGIMFPSVMDFHAFVLSQTTERDCGVLLKAK